LVFTRIFQSSLSAIFKGCIVIRSLHLLTGLSHKEDSMITPVYASILAILMCWLALQVIKERRKNRVKYADGGIEALQRVRTAHSNAVDYIPITLILLVLLELNGGNIWALHAAGIALISGRIIHAHGILNDKMCGRVLGMQITFGTIVVLALLNLVWLPYARLLPL